MNSRTPAIARLLTRQTLKPPGWGGHAVSGCHIPVSWDPPDYTLGIPMGRAFSAVLLRPQPGTQKGGHYSPPVLPLAQAACAGVIAAQIAVGAPAWPDRASRVHASQSLGGGPGLSQAYNRRAGHPAAGQLPTWTQQSQAMSKQIDPEWRLGTGRVEPRAFR